MENVKHPRKVRLHSLSPAAAHSMVLCKALPKTSAGDWGGCLLRCRRLALVSNMPVVVAQGSNDARRGSLKYPRPSLLHLTTSRLSISQ